MKIIGLTGSIATGKSFVARCFSKIGAAVFDADSAVHDLLNYKGEGVPQIKELFPESYIEGQIDRKILGDIVFDSDKKRKQLEEIIHPLVAKKREEFIKQAEKNKAKVIVLEIPLLFEVEAEKTCDVVVVTTVDSYLQEKRAMERPGMTKEKFKLVNKLQMDSKKKVEKADYVIDTALSEFAVFREVKNIMNKVLEG